MLLHLEAKMPKCSKCCEKCSSCDISCFTCIKKSWIPSWKTCFYDQASRLHLRDSLVTDMLPILLENNKPAACERTFLAKIVSLATGFSGVTSPQMHHPSGRPGLFIATAFRCSYLHFPRLQKYLGLVPRASHPEGRTPALRFQPSARLSQTSLGMSGCSKPEHQHSPKS